MKTRIIHTKFWEDQYITNLNKVEKLVFIYLLTNSRVNICGIYELPDKYIFADLNITRDELQTIKKKFEKDKRFFFYDGWVKIPRVSKYNSYKGNLNEVAKNKELALVPSKLIGIGRGIDTSIDTSIDTLRNKKSEIRNKKSEIRNQKKRTEELRKKAHFLIGR